MAEIKLPPLPGPHTQGMYGEWQLREYARAAVELNRAAVPEGYALVLVEPTEEMHIAACKVLLRAPGLDGLPKRMLTAMLAAPQPAPQEELTPSMWSVDHEDATFYFSEADAKQASEDFGGAKILTYALLGATKLPQRIDHLSLSAPQVVQQEVVKALADRIINLNSNAIIDSGMSVRQCIESEIVAALGCIAPAEKPVPMTTEQLNTLWQRYGIAGRWLAWARAIEAHHGIVEEKK